MSGFTTISRIPVWTHHEVHTVYRLLVVAAATLVAGCAEPLASPKSERGAFGSRTDGAEPHLFSPVTLNAFLNGGGYDASGRIQLSLGRVPPGPCRGANAPPA